MKIITTILALLLISFVFTGCAGENENNQGVINTDDSEETVVINYPDENATKTESNHYNTDFASIIIPPNWHISNETQDLLSLSLSSPDELASIQVITITRMESDGEFMAYDYAEMTASGLNQSNIQQTTIGETTWVELWGKVEENLLWQFLKDSGESDIIQISITATEPTLTNDAQVILESFRESY